MIIRYVNTASAAGGDGTTPSLSGATRAWGSLREGLMTYRSLGALPDQVDIYCKGVAADTNSLDHTPMEFTTTPTNYLRVIGDNVTGLWNELAYRITTLNESALYNQYAAHVRFINCQHMVKITDGGDYHCFRLSTANNDISAGDAFHVFQNCIARKDPTSTSGNTNGFYDSEGGVGGTGGFCYRINCIACDGCTIGFGSAWSTAAIKNYNCLGYACSRNYEDPETCTNCVSVLGAVAGFNSVGGVGSNNISDDGSAFGTGSKTGQNFANTFVDAASLNFRLKAIDAVLRGAGLADPGSGLFLDDITGALRGSSWDAGPHQYVPLSTLAYLPPDVRRALRPSIFAPGFGR